MDPIRHSLQLFLTSFSAHCIESLYVPLVQAVLDLHCLASSDSDSIDCNKPV